MAFSSFQPLVIFFLFLLEISSIQAQKSYRLCAPLDKMKSCEEMIANVSSVTNVKCVPTIDKINCIEKISKDEADFVPLDPEEIYVAHRYLKDGFHIIAEIRSAEFKDRDFRYEPVAVVRKSSGITSIPDLKEKKSCHTGFGRNAGWKIPFSHLMDKKQLPELCKEIKGTTTERDLYTISNYFKEACAAGIWVAEKDKDKELKQRYSNLCQLCSSPETCSSNDTYFGYDGALKCLVEKEADIAWTKMDAVISFFKLGSSNPLPIVADYSFLCWDGSSIDLNLNETCSWAKRPWTAYVASSRLSPTDIEELQKSITSFRDEGVKEAPNFPSWINSILAIGSDKSKTKFDIIFSPSSHTAKVTSPFLYLEKGKNYTVTIEKPSCATQDSLKFCVKSELEKNKCLALQLASVGRRVWPKVDCVLAESQLDCIKQVSSGQADFVNLSPKDSDWAQVNYGLVPVLSEVEVGPTPQENAPFRYALAVVKAKDAESFRNISVLFGKKSCHDSVNSLAGWNAPISKLKEIGLIKGQTCGLPIAMSQFFGNHSCAPGTPYLAAKERMWWLPQGSLCSLCVGDGSKPGNAFTPESICSGDPSERYFGPQGVLRCLMEAGDVAFTDHVGLLKKALTAEGEFKSEDFKLLCPVGGTTELTNYQHCHWGKVPSNQILSRGGDESEIKREDVKLTLLKIAETFSTKAAGVLKLFGPYFGNSDLLFQDSSVGICDYRGVEEHKKLIKDYDYCTTSGASSGIKKGFVSVMMGVLVGVLAGGSLSRV